MPNVVIRMAHTNEGPLIGRWVADWGGPSWEWLDWSQCAPYWLVGEVDSVVRGVAMVHPGIPFGRMEMMCVDPSLDHKHKALLCRDFAYAGLESCKALGSQAMIVCIDHDDQDWKRIITRRGGIEMGSGTYMLKRCL